MGNSSTNIPVPQGQIVVRPKGSSKCVIHKDNEVIFICQECEQLICTTCTITTHKTHINTFVELSQDAKQKKENMLNFLNDIENCKLPQLESDIQAAKEDLEEIDQNFQVLSANMKEHGDHCRQELEKVIQEWDSNCDTLLVENKELLQNHLTKLQERYKHLVQLSTELKQTLQSGTAVLIYDSASKIQNYDSDNPRLPNIDTSHSLLRVNTSTAT